MRKRMFTILMSVIVGAGLVSSAAATTSEWFYGKDRAAAIKAVGKGLLTKIECRDTGRKGLDVADFQYRITYVDNPDEIKILWAIGNAYGPYRERAKREGYKQVS